MRRRRRNPDETSRKIQRRSHLDPAARTSWIRDQVRRGVFTTGNYAGHPSNEPTPVEIEGVEATVWNRVENMAEAYSYLGRALSDDEALALWVQHYVNESASPDFNDELAEINEFADDVVDQRALEEYGPSRLDANKFLAILERIMPADRREALLAEVRLRARNDDELRGALVDEDWVGMNVSLNPPPREFHCDPGDYNAYVTWLMFTVLGGLSQADSIMRDHEKSVRKVAKKLRKALGVPKTLVHRGILLEASEVPSSRMILPQQESTFFSSWSADRDVACWFADRDSVMSGFVSMIRPGVRGWLMKIVPDKKDVLFHYSWVDNFPYPGGGHANLIRMARKSAPALVSQMPENATPPSMAADQIEWALRSQKEVVLGSMKKAVKVIPHSEAGCKPTSELDRKLTWSGVRNNPTPGQLRRLIEEKRVELDDAWFFKKPSQVLDRLQAELDSLIAQEKAASESFERETEANLRGADADLAKQRWLQSFRDTHKNPPYPGGRYLPPGEEPMDLTPNDWRAFLLWIPEQKRRWLASLPPAERKRQEDHLYRQWVYVRRHERGSHQGRLF